MEDFVKNVKSVDIPIAALVRDGNIVILKYENKEIILL